jgi:subtilisin family serine protease
VINNTPQKLLALALAGGLVACATDDIATDHQAVNNRIIVTCLNGLPGNFADTVAANGDSVRHQHANGFAVVNTANPDAYAALGCSVTNDVVAQFVDPHENVAYDAANPPNSGDDDFLFDLQWGHDAVNAVEAWNAGVTGAGARVAVLDTGFDVSHPDLQPNISSLSADFTGEGLEWGIPGDVFSHGTHTAGTIAAANNGYGTIGVAPDAELVLIKVLGDSGSGSFGDVIAGMYYAADVHANIASMSLGAAFPRHVDTGPNKLIVAMTHAVNYMRANGTTVIAAAGNDSMDLDHVQDVVHTPSDLAGVLSISALGPQGWAADRNVSLDNLAIYSNYGQSSIAFSAPGGDYSYAFMPGGFDACTVGFVTRPCYVFDFVFSTGAYNSWYWSVGTSMATPHAAGVAALLVSEGFTSPAALEAELRARADDLGKPGKDDVHGLGRVSSGY